MPSLEGWKCLVLGGGGFIGLNLCQALRAQGAQVRVYDRGGRDDRLPADVGWHSGDFSDSLRLQDAVDGCNAVFHLINQTPLRIEGEVPITPSASLDVAGTARLLEICHAKGVRTLLFASSGGAVYGVAESLPIAETAPTNPISPYGTGKLAIENLLQRFERSHGLRHLSLRIANPYGRYQSGARRQGVVATFIARAMKGEDLEIWGDGEIVRDFIHIDDVVAAFIAGLTYQGDLRVMNVGSGDGRRVRSVAQDVIASLPDRGIAIRHLPGSVYDAPAVILDISRIAAELGWKPLVSWQQGLRRAIADMSAQG